MKKVCILFMVFVMIVSFSFPALAENEPTIDFSTINPEELMRVYEAARNELLLRIGSPADNFIGRGTFVAGQTILPGTFDFVCTESGAFTDSGFVNNEITVTASDYSQTFRASKISIDGHVTFTLVEGDTLEIKGCSGTIDLIIDPTWVP